MSPTMARLLYERELAYFEADRSFLPLEKCAERCRKLSALLAVAVFDGHGPGLSITSTPVTGERSDDEGRALLLLGGELTEPSEAV